MAIGEIILLPGVEKTERGEDEVELRVGGKPFAHLHGSDRIEVRLPPDMKESLVARGMASRSPEVHDREGWVTLKVTEALSFPQIMRVLQEAYRFTSSTL